MRAARIIACFFSAAIASAGLCVQAATLNPGAGPFIPNTDEFASAIVMVPKTHQILYAFKPDHHHVVASLTKLANAIAFAQLKLSWDRVVSIKSVDEVGGGRLRVRSGTRMTVRDLFYSSLTASANNAATALARISGLGTMGFVRRMNQEVQRLGAKHTQLFDASGMNPQNISTARDIALIAERAFQDPMIRRAASTAQYQFALVGSTTVKTIKNTNHLLTDDPDVWVIGGKTGYLDESKYNLVVELRPLDERGQPDATKDLFVVVMGAPTKDAVFATAKRMVLWAWENHTF